MITNSPNAEKRKQPLEKIDAVSYDVMSLLLFLKGLPCWLVFRVMLCYAVMSVYVCDVIWLTRFDTEKANISSCSSSSLFNIFIFQTFKERVEGPRILLIQAI